MLSCCHWHLLVFTNTHFPVSTKSIHLYLRNIVLFFFHVLMLTCWSCFCKSSMGHGIYSTKSKINMFSFEETYFTNIFIILSTLAKLYFFFFFLVNSNFVSIYASYPYLHVRNFIFLTIYLVSLFVMLFFCLKENTTIVTNIERSIDVNIKFDYLKGPESNR